MRAHLTAASLAAALAFATPAAAADLGGNCCADLEERVAELEATTARKGNRKVSVEVSGHVNQALFTTDIDGLDELQIIDNSNSESRFRLTGKAALSPEWEAGFLMEFGLGGYELDVRHQALYLKVKALGTLWLGLTSEATDGITEISLAPSEASTLTSLAPFDAAVLTATGIRVDNPFDGKRTETVTFRTETLAGFQGAISWNEGDDWSAALRYAGEFGQIRLAGGIGYRHEGSGAVVGTLGDRNVWGGSASIMHIPTGIFLDGAYAHSDGVQTIGIVIPNLFDITVGLGDFRMELYAARGGISKRLNALGTTTIYGEYGQLAIQGVSADPRFWGLGIQQDVDAGAMSLYAGWRQYDFDVGAPDDEVNTFVGGVKVRF